MSPAALAWFRFRRHKAGLAGAVFLLLLAAAAWSAPLIEAGLGIDADSVDLFARYAAPSAEHLLGADDLGRDLLARLLRGGQVSLAVGLAAAFIAALIGTGLGLLAGYRGGAFDTVLMRFTDGMIALPLLPLLIVLAAVDLGKLGLDDGTNASLFRVIAIVALVGWTTVARLVRAAALAARAQDYVRAARALGAGSGRIALKHILPNVASPILVATTLSVGNIILFESVLSFLGLGIQPPAASWGNMLAHAQETIWQAPRLAVWPGLLIFATVIAFNFLGDALQDALDPRS